MQQIVKIRAKKQVKGKIDRKNGYLHPMSAMLERYTPDTDDTMELAVSAQHIQRLLDMPAYRSRCGNEHAII